MNTTETTTRRDLEARIIRQSIELSRLRDENEALRQLAYYDQMTGCLNRRGLYEKAETMQASAGHAGLVVSVVDANGLKTINDTQGHEAGDAYIVSISEVLRGEYGPLVARIGGDEWVVIATEFVVSAPGYSAGSSVWHDGEALDEAIKRADASMYKSKRDHYATRATQR